MVKKLKSREQPAPEQAGAGQEKTGSILQKVKVARAPEQVGAGRSRSRKTDESRKNGDFFKSINGVSMLLQWW